LHKAFAIKSGEVPKSGQIITPVWNSSLGIHEWVVGWTSGLIPYFATQNYFDHDVVEAGNLVGLPAYGKYRLHTGYWKAADAASFNDGTPVGPDGTTGDIKVTTLESGVPIIGYVSMGLRGPKDIYGEDDEAAPDDDGKVLVVCLDTAYAPNTADAT